MEIIKRTQNTNYGDREILINKCCKKIQSNHNYTANFGQNLLAMIARCTHALIPTNKKSYNEKAFIGISNQYFYVFCARPGIKDSRTLSYSKR